MKIRIFGVLALVLSGLSCPSLAEAHNLHNMSIAVHSGGEATPLGSFTLDDIEDDPLREFPWQVSLSFDGDNGDLDFTLTILDTVLLIEEHVAFNFQQIHPSLDDGDLDLFLVNAPGGDNSIRFSGVISAVHVPEPSTFAFVLIAALFVPLGARGIQRRSGL